MNAPTVTRQVAVAIVVAAFVAGSAQAENRCKDPFSTLDQRVCALAKQGPDELRRFIDRTRSIYGLYFYDYATEADFERWEAARRAQQQHAVVATRRPAMSESGSPR